MEQENKKFRIGEHKLLFIVLAVLIAVTAYRLVNFAIERRNPTVEDTIPTSVKVAHAGFGTVATTTPISGRIVPAEEVAVVPLAAGQVTAVYAEVGDYVKSGQVLFTIDGGQVATQYNSAKAAYDLAAQTYSNMEALYAEGAVSKVDVDSARVQYISAQQSLAAVGDMLGNYSVKSPIDGYVTSLSVSVGGVAGQAMAASVANTDKLKIDTSVSEYIAKLIKVGDEVDVYVNSVREEPFAGTITNFSPAPALGTLTYPITVSLDNSDGALMSGQFAEIKVVSDEAEESIVVPSNAVLLTEGRNVVVVLDEDDIPRFVDVVMGLDNGSEVQILSGLSGGERIVVSGQDFVDEGIAVKVVSEE